MLTETMSKLSGGQPVDILAYRDAYELSMKLNALSRVALVDICVSLACAKRFEMTDDKAAKAATDQQRLQLEKLMSDVVRYSSLFAIRKSAGNRS